MQRIRICSIRAVRTGETRQDDQYRYQQYRSTGMDHFPQLLIRVDRQAIARYGINVVDVQETIQAAVGGSIAGQIFEGIRRFDILVRYEPEARSTSRAIQHILVPHFFEALDDGHYLRNSTEWPTHE